MATPRAVFSAGCFALLVGGGAAGAFYGVAVFAGLIGMYDEAVYGGTALALILGLIVGAMFGLSRVPPPPKTPPEEKQP
jgi:hypothetical protein